MSQDDSPAPQVSQSDFDFIRLKLGEVSDKIQWIQMEDSLRERVLFCLSQVSVERLAEEVSLAQPRLEEFLRQKAELDLLLKEIAEDRDRHRDSRYINYSDQTRAKIDRYFDLTSV